MSESVVKIRVRVGANEAEIEAPMSAIREAIQMVPDVVQQLPQPHFTQAPHPQLEPSPAISHEKPGLGYPAISRPTSLPEIRVEKDDSLPTVITKFFIDPWGRQPRKLSDIREVLESYGLIYPKQSVAVALLRLAKEGKLRRFKDEDGEFVYTASMSISGDEPLEASIGGEGPSGQGGIK